jgi:hypothetical protein
MTLTFAYGALWILSLFTLLLAVGIYGEVRKLEHRGSSIESKLPVGSRAPTFAAVDAGSGQIIRSADLKGREYLLLFVSPSCGMCARLIAEVRQHGTEFLLVICRGSKGQCGVYGQELPADVRLLLDPEGQVADRYGTLSVPTAVAVNAANRIQGYVSPSKYSDLVSLRKRQAEPGVVPPARSGWLRPASKG